MPKVPQWVEQAVGDFFHTAVRDDEDWEELKEGRWANIVSIHYPPAAMVYYIVERLEDDGEWYELSGTFYTEELAESNAKKHAYNDAKPCRVRMVVEDV